MGVDPWVDTFEFEVEGTPCVLSPLLFGIRHYLLFEELILTVTPCIGVHYGNFTKFSQLILRKIIKIAATRCQILRLKCTKFDFGWGAYSAPQNPYLDLRGHILLRVGERKGRNGKGTHSGFDPVPLCLRIYAHTLISERSHS